MWHHLPLPLVAPVITVVIASAAHAGGSGAQKLRVPLVTAYAECTAPNTVVSDAFPATGAPACGPPVRSDPTCGFGPDGRGEITVAVTGRGVRVGVRLTGLDAGCEGALLSLAKGARATTGACAGGTNCTVVDGESASLLPARPCTVSEGRCRMGGELPVGDLPDAALELAVHDFAVERMPGNVRTFAAGFRLPRGTRQP